MNTTERLIGILDSEEENRRLELAIDAEGTPRLALKLSTYCEGLGWHTQKTIYIEAGQAEELQFLLGGARSLLKQAAKKTERGETDQQSVQTVPSAAKVMEFAPPARKSA